MLAPAPAASFGYFCPGTLWVYKTETQEYTFVGLAAAGPSIFSLPPDLLRSWFPSVSGQRRYLVRFCRGWCPPERYAGLPIIQDEW